MYIKKFSRIIEVLTLVFLFLFLVQGSTNIFNSELESYGLERSFRKFYNITFWVFALSFAFYYVFKKQTLNNKYLKFGFATIFSGLSIYLLVFLNKLSIILDPTDYYIGLVTIVLFAVLLLVFSLNIVFSSDNLDVKLNSNDVFSISIFLSLCLALYFLLDLKWVIPPLTFNHLLFQNITVEIFVPTSVLVISLVLNFFVKKAKAIKIIMTVLIVINLLLFTYSSLLWLYADIIGWISNSLQSKFYFVANVMLLVLSVKQIYLLYEKKVDVLSF